MRPDPWDWDKVLKTQSKDYQNRSIEIIDFIIIILIPNFPPYLLPFNRSVFGDCYYYFLHPEDKNI